MQRKYLLPAVLAALPVLLSPDLGSGRASDGKLSLLWRPASTQPVVRLRGAAFPILAVAPASAKGWEAKLVPPYSSWKLIKLQLSTPAYDKKSKRWKISATIPLTTPEELYGLQLSHSGGSDTNKISVRTANQQACQTAALLDFAASRDCRTILEQSTHPTISQDQ